MLPSMISGQVVIHAAQRSALPRERAVASWEGWVTSRSEAEGRGVWGETFIHILLMSAPRESDRSQVRLPARLAR